MVQALLFSHPWQNVASFAENTKHTSHCLYIRIAVPQLFHSYTNDM